MLLVSMLERHSATESPIHFLLKKHPVIQLPSALSPQITACGFLCSLFIRKIEGNKLFVEDRCCYTVFS